MQVEVRQPPARMGDVAVADRNVDAVGAWRFGAKSTVIRGSGERRTEYALPNLTVPLVLHRNDRVGREVDDSDRPSRRTARRPTTSIGAVLSPAMSSFGR